MPKAVERKKSKEAQRERRSAQSPRPGGSAPPPTVDQLGGPPPKRTLSHATPAAMSEASETKEERRKRRQEIRAERGLPTTMKPPSQADARIPGNEEVFPSVLSFPRGVPVRMQTRIALRGRRRQLVEAPG
jgi:hypothetical protein